MRFAATLALISAAACMTSMGVFADDQPAVSPRVEAKVSGPVTTLFGVPVGVRLPGSPLDECSKPDRGARSLCRDGEAERMALDPARRDGAIGALAAVGLRWMLVRLDDPLVDTTALRGMEPRARPVELVIDGADVVQYASFATPVYARERVLAALSAKYGKPMRTESFGAPLAPAADRAVAAPAYFWDFVNVTIEYRSQRDDEPSRVTHGDASRMGGGAGAVGRISVFLPTFEDGAARLDATRRKAATPVKP